MLNQPLMEKLVAMRWQGMVEGLKTQEQDRAIHELSFLERLSLLVDQQWNWRENQALERRLKAAKLKGPACVEDIDYRAARGLDKSVLRALAKDSTWVRNHENVFVIGPCGVGKGFLASALAQKGPPSLKTILTASKATSRSTKPCSSSPVPRRTEPARTF